MATPTKCPSRLADRWVFWLDKWDSNNGQTVQSLADIGEADTARAFWNIFDANPVDTLPESCSLHVFKGQVRPEWEDKANINGGHFRFTPLPDQPNASPGRLWYNLVLGAIGNQFMLSSSVVGVGFTNKGSRKVVSVWISTAEQSVVRALQADMHVHTGERFVSKFVAHQNIPRSDFTAQETVLHRRTQSAPSQYVSIDVGDDDDVDGNELSGSAGEKSSSSATLKRKGAPAPLDSTLAHSSTANESHGRSKSEGVSRDIVPNVRPLGAPASNAPSASHSVRSSKPPNTASPPPMSGGSTLPTPNALHPPMPAGPGQPLPSRQESEWNWQDSHSTELRDSNSGVYAPASMKAPTPMKEWADQWSPSLMNANRPQQALDASSNVTSPGATSDAHTAHQHQLLQAANAQGGPHGESPMNLSRTQPQSAMLAAAADPYAVNHQPPLHQDQNPQPFGSFPLQVHQQMAQQQPQQQQQQMHNPYQQPTYAHYTAPPPQLPGATAYPTQLPYVIVRHPVSHHSPPASDAQRAAPIPGPQRGAARAPVPERSFPLRQPSESADRSSRSPPPRASVGSNQGVGSGLRRDSPPPKSTSPPPSVAAATAAGGASADRRTQHTKSDAPPFLFKGWMFPSGLNRKERRRIMFSEDVNFAEYPGAVFKDESFPDGPCDESGNPVPENEA